MAASIAYQAHTMMDGHPWMLGRNISLDEFDKSFAANNWDKGGYIRKSSTLFPLRLYPSTPISRLDREEDRVPSIRIEKSNLTMPPHCYSFSSLVKEENLRSNLKIADSFTENDDQDHGLFSASVDLPSIIHDTSSSEVEVSPQKYDEPSKYSSQNKEANQRRRKLSLGRIPNFVKCFTCERRIKEDHFSEHLLFGIVTCSRCNATFKECQNFQFWLTEYAMGDVSCNHDFSYPNDPVAYITEKLSTEQTEHITDGEELKSALEKYIHKLRSLETRSPWQHAMHKCEDYVSIKQLKHSNLTENNSDISKSTNEGNAFGSTMRDVVSTNIFESMECSIDGTSGRVSTQSVESFGSCTSPLEWAEKDNLDHVNNAISESTLRHEISSSSNLMSGGYEQDNPQPGCSFWTEADQDILQDVHEINEVQWSSSPTHSLLESNTKNSEATVDVAPNFKKEVRKRKKKLQKGVSKKSRTDGENKTGNIPVPSDGSYLVSRKHIEECPNCYEIICPSIFTVNIHTFLLTGICDGCDLTIFIANEGLTILNEDKKGDRDANSNISISDSPKKQSKVRTHCLTKHPFVFGQ